VLVLEPIVAYLGYVYYSGKRIIPYEIFAGSMLIVMIYRWISTCDDTSVGNDGYLNWCSINNIDMITTIFRAVFMMTIIYPLLYFPDVPMKIAVISATIVSWLINLKTQTFGSRWCHAFYVSDLLILGLLLLRR